MRQAERVSDLFCAGRLQQPLRRPAHFERSERRQRRLRAHARGAKAFDEHLLNALNRHEGLPLNDPRDDSSARRALDRAGCVMWQDWAARAKCRCSLKAAR